MILFVNENAQEIEARIISAWEQLSGRTMQPGSPERVFAAWMTAAIVPIYERINFAANQNLLSTAEGEYLDNLAQMYGDIPRPQAQSAITRMIFFCNEEAASDVTIPAGTRVSTADGTVIFRTNYAGIIPAGERESDYIYASCEVPGPAGNGYIMDQVNTMYGPVTGVDGCRNVDTTSGGADVMSDEDYRAHIKAHLATYSTAGARRAYEEIAKTVDSRIADVCVIQPDGEPGNVTIYALLDSGQQVSADIRALILAACSADTVRPLTDVVSVEEATYASYTIDLTYYIRADITQSAEEVQNAVIDVVNAYRIWQSTKFGRDINPSVLTEMLMRTGLLKRVEITSPTFRELADGRDGQTPEHAFLTASIITDGGVEDE